jgi:hypothetical protein
MAWGFFMLRRNQLEIDGSVHILSGNTWKERQEPVTELFPVWMKIASQRACRKRRGAGCQMVASPDNTSGRNAGAVAGTRSITKMP